MNWDIPANQTCPMSDAVRRIARNAASAEEQSLVEQHLDACAACQAIAEEDHTRCDIDAALQKISARKDASPGDLTIPIRQLNEALSDYEILEQIGKGGMGVVYKARQIHLGRLVALKVLPSFYGVVRPALLAQFRTEAGIAARLKHSSIVSIHDFGEVDGTLYYAMELIEGRTIADFTRAVRKPGGPARQQRRRPPVSANSMGDADIASDASTTGSKNGNFNVRHPEIGRNYFRMVAKWMADVADALAYAHSNNVIHGDIKPANILVTHDDRVMIADFGLAHHRAAIEEDVTRTALGTLRYMSPEQIDRSRGRPDHRSDVYSIGATLYELLTLRPMVDATHDPDVLLDVLNRDPIAPRRLMPQVPRELEIICLKACEKIPSNRYDSATEMAEDLNRWLLDLPILARRPSIPIRAAKYVRRHRGAVLASVLIVTALATSFAVYRSAQESQRQAIDATREARATAMDLGLASAVQHLFFDQPESALRGVRAVAAAFPNNIDPTLLEWAILIRIGSADQAFVRLDSARSTGALPAWVRDLHASHTESRLVEQNHDLTAMDVDELFLRGLSEKDAPKALPLMEAALEKSPDDILCNVVSCFLHQRVGNYEKMQHSADRIMLLRPNWAIGFGLRGLAVLSMGSYEDANLSLTRAILLQPDCERWWNLRSRVNLRFNRFADAEEDATKAISLAPYLETAYLNRANAKYNLKDHAGAIKDISHLIEIEERAWLYVFRSKVYGAAGAVDKQVADLIAASALEPFDADVAIKLGDCYLGVLDYSQVIREYSRALKLTPDNIGLRFKRAFVSELNRDSEFAVEEYRQLDTEGSPFADKANFFLRLIHESDEAQTLDIEFSEARPPRTLWNSRVSSYLKGEVTPEFLIGSAKTPTEIAEAQFYVARVMINNGRGADATPHLRACIQSQQVDTLEYEFANILLAIWDQDHGSLGNP